MSYMSFPLLAGGAALAVCQDLGRRSLGLALVGAGILFAATPALAADENLLAANDSEVNCTVSAKGLTRISLRDDRFASVSKLSTGVDEDDFSVVNEPNRGDIYISIPIGYTRQDVSFFGTSNKGFVYKFACKLAGEGAHQIFVTNKDLVADKPEEVARRLSPEQASVQLVRAMEGMQAIDGYEIRQPTLEPVYVGPLKVQMTLEYRGLQYQGRAMKIENKGKEPVDLAGKIAPSNAVAFSLAAPQTVLRPGQSTTAFVVLAAGDAQ